MRIDYRIALGIPGSLVGGMVLAYYVLVPFVAGGVGAELAFDCMTVTLALGTASILRGVHTSPYRNCSLEIGGMLAAFVAAVGLALRSLTLASSGRFFFFFLTIASAAAFTYVGRRMLRRMIRSAGIGSEPQPAPRDETLRS